MSCILLAMNVTIFTMKINPSSLLKTITVNDFTRLNINSGKEIIS